MSNKNKNLLTVHLDQISIKLDRIWIWKQTIKQINIKKKLIQSISFCFASSGLFCFVTKNKTHLQLYATRRRRKKPHPPTQAFS